MKLPFLTHYSKSLDQNNILSSSPPWPYWPGCANINTLSFRASDPKDTTFTSAFSDHSTLISDDPIDPVESVIRSLRSDRLFFDPDRSCSLVSTPNGVEEKRITATRNFTSTQSLVEEQEENNDNNKEIRITTGGDKKFRNKEVDKESEILTMESNNPYEDFRRSMEEMVEAYGLKEWQGFGELLDCYLKINGNENHGFIVGAFIDLLVSLSISSTTSTTPMSSTSSSSSSNATLSSFDDDESN